LYRPFDGISEAAATTAEEAAEAAAALAAEMEAAMADVGDAVTAVPASVGAAGTGNGNAQSRRLEWRAAVRCRQRDVVERRQAVETAAALEEPSEEPGAYLEVEQPDTGSLLGGEGGRGELELRAPFRGIGGVHKHFWDFVLENTMQ
jgi:hypothetical protein